MPRYVVEREFPEGLNLSVNAEGAKAIGGMIDVNLSESVTWIHTYVSTDQSKRTYCVYDAPSPEAIRRVGAKNSMPVGRITEVRVLDPYFFR